MEQDERENLKEEHRGLKDSLSNMLYVLFFVFCIVIGVLAFIDLLVPTNIWEALEDAFRIIVGLIFWAVVGIFAYLIKGRWDKWQERRMWDEISRDIRENPPKEYEEYQVHFFRKNPKYPKQNHKVKKGDE